MVENNLDNLKSVVTFSQAQIGFMKRNLQLKIVWTPSCVIDIGLKGKLYSYM